MIKSELRKMKRECKPFIIMFVIVDIVIIGAYIVAANNNIGLTGFERIQAILAEFFNDIISLKFLSAIFVDFFSFVNLTFWTFIVFVIMFFIWKIKFAKSSEYDGIEHGSSDWAKNGEEFDKLDNGKEILNKKDGFILSKNHYLGTDLQKVIINKNILVVGRIRCW